MGNNGYGKLIQEVWLFMQKENPNSTGRLEFPKKRHRKNKIFLSIGFAFILIPLSIGFYLWQPGVCMELVGFFLPDEQYLIQVRIGHKEYKLPLFYKRRAHENIRSEIVPALVLCNIPIAGEMKHIKIFPDGLGVLQTPEKWFSVGYFSLLLREGSCLTRPLEDDMKGWNTEYHIRHENGMFHFYIHPWDRIKEPISFAIPEKLLERISCFNERNVLKSLPEVQIIKPDRLLREADSN